MTLTVNFDVGTDPNTDQILAQMRANQAHSQLPRGRDQCRRDGAEVDVVAADAVRALFAERHLRQRLPRELRLHQSRTTRSPACPASRACTVFGAGQYAMRIWVKPDQLAKLGITVPEIINAIERRTP